MSRATSGGTTDALQSVEYQAALEAQLDYDSTTEGQRSLIAELERCDESAARGLRARLTAGDAARRFRKEQVVFMPPRVSAKSPEAPLVHAIATEREHLARRLAWAAAESEVWGVPSPATSDSIRHIEQSVRDLDAALRGGEVPPFAHYSASGERGRAPWVEGPTSLPGPGDVAVLHLLGAQAAWLDGEVVITSGEEAAAAWGYKLEVDAEVLERWFIVASPAIARWHAARSKRVAQ